MLKTVCFISRSSESDNLNVPYSLTGTWDEFPRFHPSVSDVSDASDDNGSTGGRAPIQKFDAFNRFQ